MYVSLIYLNFVIQYMALIQKKKLSTFVYVNQINNEL